MEICLSCYKYACQCDCSYKDNIIEVDDDFADIILELNELFSRFQLNIKTRFCCAGHIANTDTNSILHAYILFEGDFFQITYFLSGLDRVLNEPLFVKNPELKLSFDVFNDEEAISYRLSVSLDKDTYDLSDKILFMQGKVRLMKFLADKIKAKWDEYECDF